MSIWTKYPNYEPHELRRLIKVSAEFLLDHAGDAELPPDLLQVSPLAGSKEIAADLQKTMPQVTKANIQEILQQEETAEKLCLAILGEIRQKPELADQIAAAYEQESRKMLGVVELLAVALVILAIKLKSVKISNDIDAAGGTKKKGVVVVFSEASEAVKSFLGGYLGTGG